MNKYIYKSICLSISLMPDPTWNSLKGGYIGVARFHLHEVTP